MDGASKAQLENEFGTLNEDEVIKQILNKGSVQTTEARATSDREETIADTLAGP